MSDLIDRQAVINAIANTIVNGESLGYGLAEEIMRDIPSVENKGDLISRQVVLELLQMKYFGKDLYKAIYELPSANAISIDQANAMIKSYVSHYEENKAEWIPVSERLPEDGVEVLCTVREMCDFPDDNEYDVPLTFIAQGHYINHEQKIFRGWYIKVRPDCSMGTDKVIAWMSLPEPYKGERGE